MPSNNPGGVSRLSAWMEEQALNEEVRLRQMYARWRQEWLEDGTLTASDTHFVVPLPTGGYSDPMPFVEAFMTAHTYGDCLVFRYDTTTGAVIVPS